MPTLPVTVLVDKPGAGGEKQLEQAPWKSAVEGLIKQQLHIEYLTLNSTERNKVRDELDTSLLLMLSL